MKMVNTRAPSTATAMPASTRMTIRLGLPSVGGIHPGVGSGSGAGGTQPVAGCRGLGAPGRGLVGSGCVGSRGCSSMTLLCLGGRRVCLHNAGGR